MSFGHFNCPLIGRQTNLLA